MSNFNLIIMKCKNCGAQNSEHALKCQNCNAPLDGSMVERPKSSSKVGGTIICKNCRTVNTGDALKCNHCNAPLDGSMVLDSRPKVMSGQVLCKNCKTANPEDALRCLHCNAPLDGSMVIRSDKKQGTTRGSKQKIEKSTSAIYQNESRKTCPKCGYPNQSIADACVRCHTSLADKKEAKTKAVPAEPLVKASEKKASMNLTVNPWAEPPVVPDKYSLTPLKSDFTEGGDSIPLKEGKNNLKRDNLDPGNMTITSASQAVIRCEGGKWTIEDTSTMKTTFVHVSGQSELKDGDIILLGNKLFKFSKES